MVQPEIEMRAAVLHEHRRPFAIEELDLAPPGPAEVEVRLHASGVCRSDWNTVTGDTPSPLPAVLGHEGAGVVERVGPRRRDRRARRPRRALVAPVVRALHALHERPAHALRRGGAGAPRGHAARRDDKALPGRAAASTTTRSSRPSPSARSFPRRAASGSARTHRFPIAALVGCAVTTGVGAVLNRARVAAGSSVGRGGRRRRGPLGDPRRPARRRSHHRRGRPGRAAARAGARARRDPRGRPGRGRGRRCRAS